MKKTLLSVAIAMTLSGPIMAADVTQVTASEIKTALNEAITQESYENSLSQADLEMLQEASLQGDETFKKVAKQFIKANPDKSLSVYAETQGMVTAQQSTFLAQEVGSLALAEGATMAQIASGAAFAGGTSIGTIAVVGGLAAGAAGAAAGGGGGGGGSAPQAPSTPAPEAPSEEGGSGGGNAGSIGDAAEYTNTGGFNISKGEVAHQRGYDGTGSLIAVLDSGILETHEQFGAGQIIGNYNAIKDLTNNAIESDDSDGHGTHVAGIIGAQGKNGGGIGYAPDAKLLNVRITSDSNVYTSGDAEMARAYDYSRINGADIINNSWGPTVTTDDWDFTAFDGSLPTFRDAALAADAANILSVWSTGNQGATLNQPSLFAALPEYYAALADTWVAVTNIDTDGTLNPTSQPCGRSAAWCISAPGTDIFSGYNNADNGYATMTGTSMSAPAVSGALALLSEAFPTMTPQQVRQKLFDTANKTGIYANATLYGQGLMDLDAATLPVGPSSLVVKSGENVLLADTSLNLGSAFGSVNPLSNVQTMFVDSYNAGYMTSIAPTVGNNAYRLDMQDSMDNMSRLEQQHTKEGKSLSFSFNTQSKDGVQGFENLIVTNTFASGDSVSMGYANDVNSILGTHSFAHANKSQMGDTLSSPYLQFGQNEKVRGMSFTSKLNNNETLKFASLTSEGNVGAIVAHGYKAGKAALSTQLGFVVESDRLMGSETSGALKFAGATPTTYVGVNGQYQLSKKVNLFGAAYAGNTQPKVTANSLVSNMGNVTSTSFTVGAVAEGAFEKGDALGFTVHQPMKVESASATLTVANGYNGNQFAFTDVAVDMAPDARQMNYELFYGFESKHVDDMKVSYMHIENPGHSRANPSENAVMFTVSSKF